MEHDDSLHYFSVLIPVYNGEKFIAKCIESILSQSFQDFELLICDDASTDKTSEILKQYQSDSSKIRLVIHNENKRTLIARNNLIRAARGKYCIFADADDELLPDFLEQAAKILKKQHYDIIQFSYSTASFVVWFYYNDISPVCLSEFRLFSANKCISARKYFLHVLTSP